MDGTTTGGHGADGSPPAVVVTIPFEGRPSVWLDCMNDADQARLLDWIIEHPALAMLVDDALDLEAAA